MTKSVLVKVSMGLRSLLVAVAMFAVAGMLSVVVSRGGGAVAAESGATEMRRYRNDQWKFELDIPAQWAVMPPDLANSRSEVVRFGSHENGYHNLIVFRQVVGTDKDEQDLADGTQRFLAKSGFSNFVPGESTIGSRKVMTLDFERRGEGSGWYCRHYIVKEGPTAYILGFGTTNRKGMFELYDRMAKSFVFQGR